MSAVSSVKPASAAAAALHSTDHEKELPPTLNEGDNNTVHTAEQIKKVASRTLSEKSDGEYTSNLAHKKRKRADPLNPAEQVKVENNIPKTNSKEEPPVHKNTDAAADKSPVPAAAAASSASAATTTLNTAVSAEFTLIPDRQKLCFIVKRSFEKLKFEIIKLEEEDNPALRNEIMQGVESIISEIFMTKELQNEKKEDFLKRIRLCMINNHKGLIISSYILLEIVNLLIKYVGENAMINSFLSGHKTTLASSLKLVHPELYDD